MIKLPILFRDFRYLLGWAAVLLLALTAHSQSREVLRTYVLDDVKSPYAAAAHTGWLIFSFALVALVFAAVAATIVQNNRLYQAKDYRFAVIAMAVLPLLCILAGFANAFISAADSRSVRFTVLLAAAGVTVIAVAIGSLPVFLGNTNAGQRFVAFVASDGAKRLLVTLTAVLIFYFLALPLTSSKVFTNMATTMGALPILLVSIGVVMYIVHRLLSHEATPRSGLIAWCILLLFSVWLVFEARKFGVAAFIVSLGVPIYVITQFTQRVTSYRRDVLAAIALSALVIALGDSTSANVVRTNPLAASKTSIPDIGKAFDDWFAKRVDKQEYAGKKYPVILVAAQGGGLYAAYHSALVLAHVQDRCPRFAQHVFGISGVSGGSLGAAVFRNAIAKHTPDLTPSPCLFHEPAEATFTNYTKTFLERDFLSPLVFLAIVPNIAQRLMAWIPTNFRNRAPMQWINYDRALGLEYAFEAASASADDPARGDNFFESSALGPRPPHNVGPALLLNTTRADNGERYIVAPMRLDLGDSTNIDTCVKVLAAEKPDVDISLSTAVGLSARFPFVTPPGTIQVAARRWLEEDPPERSIGLVDGGYFENSGLATAFEMAIVLKLHLDRRVEGHSIRIIVVAIGDVEGLRYSHFQPFQLKGGWFPKKFRDRIPAGDVRERPIAEAMAPLSALNASREYRGLGTLLTMDKVSQAIRCAEGTTTKCAHRRQTAGEPTTELRFIDFQLGLTTDNPLPLGWHISKLTRDRIKSRLTAVPCGEVLDSDEKWRAAMQHLSELGEDVGAYADAWLHGCAIQNLGRELRGERPN